MKIDLLRHGIAFDLSERYPTDEERPITGEGVTQLRLSAHGLRELNVRWDKVYSSPLVRARQTAEIVVPRVSEGTDIEVVDVLRPGHSPQEVCEFLRLCGHDRVLLVGHEPDLGRLAGYLIGGENAPPLPLKKGGLARVDVESAGSSLGELRWFLPPKILQRLT